MLIVTIYLVLAFFLLSLIRVVVISFLSFTKRKQGYTHTDPCLLSSSDTTWPSVVVQLPVYRENNVLNRLLSSVLKVEYPAGLMAVQVLDDSEDHEARVTEEIVSRYRDGPVPIEYIHRPHRTGYKSGALNCGLAHTRCELIAIFDADFIPRSDFLVKTVPLFRDEKIGAVHTRWSHLNDLESPLTAIQAAALDSFFCFENAILQSMGESSMYLGTSGIWRKRVIEDLGGWNDTIFTDDGTDMSCRAQLAGWFVAYVDQPLSSAELPNTYLVYKSQQRRWARGALRVLLDNWRRAFKQEHGIGSRLLDLSLIHMMLSMPALLLVGLLSGLYIVLELPRSVWWLAAQNGLMVVLVFFPVTLELLVSQKLLYQDWPQRWLMTLRAMPLIVGLSVSVLAGFLDTVRRSKAEFVATPKHGVEPVIHGSKKQWLKTAERIALLEGLLAVLALTFLIWAVIQGYTETWFLFSFLSMSLLVAGCTSWREIAQKRSVASASN